MDLDGVDGPDVEVESGYGRIRVAWSEMPQDEAAMSWVIAVCHDTPNIGGHSSAQSRVFCRPNISQAHHSLQVEAAIA